MGKEEWSKQFKNKVDLSTVIARRDQQHESKIKTYLKFTTSLLLLLWHAHSKRSALVVQYIICLEERNVI